MEGIHRALAFDSKQPAGIARDLRLGADALRMRRVDLVQLGGSQVVGDGSRQNEITVGQALHQRTCPQAVGTMIGEVCLADHMQPGNGAHEVVVHPEPAHGVVDGGVDSHRRPIGILVGDSLVHLEQVAVAVPNGGLP